VYAREPAREVDTPAADSDTAEADAWADRIRDLRLADDAGDGGTP
jgi:hypothetical protein